MARTKIRKHQTVEQVKEVLNEYFELNYDEVIKYLLSETGFESMEQLKEAEYYGAFGLDCGWVWATTKNQEQYHEWCLDNGKYDAYVRRINYPYNSQSTICKRIELEYALSKLGLESEYRPYVRLD